jgi:protein transport protein SEC31
LTKYAKVLGEQGCAATALNYISTSEDISISILRDRLFYSLGYDCSPGQQVPPKPFKVIDVLPEIVRPAPQPAVAQARNEPRSRTTSANYNTVQQPQVQPSAPTNQFASVPTSQFVSAPANQFVSNPANQFSTNNQFSTIAQEPVNPVYPQSPTYFDSTRQPQNFAANPAAAPCYSKGPLGKYHQPRPAYDSYPQDVSPIPQQYNVAPANPLYNPAAPHQTPGAPLMSTTDPTPSYQTAKPAVAWNDPPVTSGKSSRKTHGDHAPGAPRYDGQIYNPQEYQEQLTRQHQQQHQQQHIQFQQHQQQQHQQQLQQQQQQQHLQYQPQAQPTPEQMMPIAKLAPTPPIEVRTLPAEHQVIKDVLDRLVELCLERAHNPPTKKKLEDVIKKLEVLYNRLCTGSLSQATITGLHQIVIAIQGYDYNTALANYAQIISIGSFTEISSFFPAIKVLMQTAAQMQVYIQ